MRNSNILDDIKELRKNIDEFKSTQSFVGDSLVFYQLDSGNEYDWSGTLNHPGQDVGSMYTQLVVKVTATNVPILFSDLIVVLLDGGDGIPISSVAYGYLADNQQGFYVFINGTTSTGTIKVKLYIICNDTNASLSVEQVPYD